MIYKTKDITGRIYNRLTAIKFSHKAGVRNRAKWLFFCVCGNKKVINKYSVICGRTRSCGCLLEESKIRLVQRLTTHGLSGGHKKTSEFKAWQGFKGRCLNPNDANYKNYGGRGIQVCDRWLNSFPNFLEDMGKKPTKEHSIDRIDNNGNYEANNCRWATHLQQNSNTRNNIIVNYKDKDMTLTQWSELLGIKYHSSLYFYHKGLSLQQIINKYS